MTGTEPITVFKVNIGVFLSVRKIKNKAKSRACSKAFLVLEEVKAVL